MGRYSLSLTLGDGMFQMKSGSSIQKTFTLCIGEGGGALIFLFELMSIFKEGGGIGWGLGVLKDNS